LKKLFFLQRTTSFPIIKIHISSGFLNGATQECSEFRRIAVGRHVFGFLFVAHKKELARRCDKPASASKARVVVRKGYNTKQKGC
jgi:hypothetical protein